MNLELIIYPKAKLKTSGKTLSFSPFCAKTEALLKLCKVDHRINEFKGNPSVFKKAKLPVVKFGEEVVCDSWFIEREVLARFKSEVNNHLSKEQYGKGFAYLKMTEEFLYWSLAYERWFIEKNWVKLRELYFSAIPSLIRGFVTNKIKKDFKKSFYGHGIGRHSEKEIHDLGVECIKSLSLGLGEQTYFLGEQISTYDTGLWAFLANTYHCDLNPELQKNLCEFPNLISYVERLDKVFL